MSRFRDHIRQARRTLHEHMSVPALFFAWPSPEVIKPVTVRVHDKFTYIGDLKGTNFHYAEIEDNSPRIVFMRSEVELPKRGMIITIEPGIGYSIDHVQPPDDISVTAKVVRLRAEEVATMPTPERGGHLPLFAGSSITFPPMG